MQGVVTPVEMMIVIGGDDDGVLSIVLVTMGPLLLLCAENLVH